MKHIVYLAGGMRSNWQQKVIDNVDLIFYNPCNKEIDRKLELSEYGNWDLFHIKKSDIVFAYFEKDNPSGIGMSVELGYAKALGKTIILCYEGSDRKYCDFMKLVADVVFDKLENAIEYLELYG